LSVGGSDALAGGWTGGIVGTRDYASSLPQEGTLGQEALSAALSTGHIAPTIAGNWLTVAALESSGVLGRFGADQLGEEGLEIISTLACLRDDSTLDVALGVPTDVTGARLLTRLADLIAFRHSSRGLLLATVPGVGLAQGHSGDESQRNQDNEQLTNRHD